MQLRPYQQEIVDSVVAGLRHGSIGQVRMACGSGKTVVGMHAAMRMVPRGGTVAVLLPSVALAAQTLATWSFADPDCQVLAVCSDDGVADLPVHTSDLPVPVTTNVVAALDAIGMRW